MAQNHIGNLRLYSDGTRPNSGLPGTGFGLDFAVIYDPAAANSKQGEGTYYWSGIAGTWFWIDPKNDLFFVGMIQRRGGAGPGAVNFRADSTRLVYDALLPK
jgi:CubicO group peptidase (beta-lactamase class C family)